MSEFTLFLADLHVCSVIPIVLSDFSDPELMQYIRGLPLSLPATRFHAILQRLDQLLIDDSDLLHKLEATFY